MSTLAVGIDLVDIDEVRESVQRFGDRYLFRVYSASEVAYAQTSEHECAARLAARFAAKEAVIKLLAPVEEPIPWRDIEVCRAPSGQSHISLSGAAKRLAEERRMGQISLSLAHHGRTAIAMAAALANSNEAEPSCP